MSCQCGYSLLPKNYLRYPGNVVNLVTGQGQLIRNLVRAHTKLFADRAIVEFFIIQVRPPDIRLADQLGKIFIRGQNCNRQMRRTMIMRQRPNEIVRLPMLAADAGNTQQFKPSPAPGKLASEFFRGRAAICLVFGKNRLARRLRAAFVKCKYNSLRRLFG